MSFLPSLVTLFAVTTLPASTLATSTLVTTTAPLSAELIVHNARVITVNERFHIAQAIAVRAGRIVAVGTDKEVLSLGDKNTRFIDAQGKMVLPGLIDSHTHPISMVTTELADPPPVIRSLKEAFAYIRKQAQERPKGEWIVLRYAFPTRLDEARFPTKAELDEVAPHHPVLFHAGPAGVANSKALEVSKVTASTPNPPGGRVVKDERTGEPTGLLRNAYSVLRQVPREADRLKPQALRQGVKRLFHLYNQRGLTGIADRSTGREGIRLYQDLAKTGELTLRVTVSPRMDPMGPRDQVIRRLLELEGKSQDKQEKGKDKQGKDKQDKDKQGKEDLKKDDPALSPLGPTGAGDDWVRIGPIKIFLDGGMLNGTAFMRQPWPMGPTYQVTEKDYHGLLFVPEKQLQLFVEEAARRRWQVTAHCAGEAAMDVLLDSYAHANRGKSIRPLRWCITHANFPSKINLERCKELGVCADVQPAWLYKDGATLARVLSPERIRWFQPYKSWMEYTVIGGGSDHMLRYDTLDSTNPWDPWLGIWVALTRSTERGGKLVVSEALSREQALRLYTINNAYLHHQEKNLGSLEVGKLADLILVDRDILTCPVDDVRHTQVLLTIVDGRIVYQHKAKE